MKVSYNWLQEYFKEPLPTVAEVEETFMMHALEVDGTEQVGSDTIIDLDVLPNRAHDCLGHRGVAKELATLLGRELKKDELKTNITDITLKQSSELSIDVQDEEWCPRYTAALVKGVKVADSPEWLKQKLEALGQKSISNVVDITNYVMFGIGQPTHIFDAKKLTDNNGVKVGVRKARDGESITVLGGDEYELKSSMAVITDANSDTPIAIAGIKGGVVAEVDDSTVDIVVESAKFHPIKTRRASAALKLRTDAVQRFENEISIELPPYGVYEVARLITEVAGGEIEGYVDSNPIESAESKVTISMAGLNSFLGSEITIDEAVSIIKRFDWTYEADGEELTVIPPFERMDVSIVEAVYEEIGRVYGWGNIESKSLPQPGPEKFINKERAYSELLRKVMLEQGITETMTYTLCSEGDIKLASILSSDKDHVRANLSMGIAKALDKATKDAPLLGEYEMVKVYEVGRVFTKGGEHTSAAIGVRALSKKKAAQKQDAVLADVKAVIEKELGAELRGATMQDGILEFNLSDTYADLQVPREYAKLPLITDGLKYAQVSQYPFVNRDIAIWVSCSAEATQDKPCIEEKERELRDVILGYGGELVQRIDKFDEFAKEGKVSLAFHIIFQATDRTLIDDEVNEIMEKIEDTLNSAKEFEVR